MGGGAERTIAAETQAQAAYAAAVLDALGIGEQRVWYAPQVDLEAAEAAGYEGAYELKIVLHPEPDVWCRRVRDAAARCAREFCEAFPGETLEASSDYDAIAWEEVATELGVPEDRQEDLWELFCRELPEQIEKLVESATAPEEETP
jgi:hypothetical protein